MLAIACVEMGICGKVHSWIENAMVGCEVRRPAARLSKATAGLNRAAAPPIANPSTHKPVRSSFHEEGDSTLR